MLPGAWGTVADCLLRMTQDVKSALDSGWRVDKYMFGKDVGTKKQGLDNDDYEARIDLVDDALSNPFWWSYWFMLARVAKRLRLAIVWAEGFPCHDQVRGGHDDEDDGSDDDDGQRQAIRDLRSAAASWPLRARRCAELAAGYFSEVIADLFQQEGAMLIWELPPFLPDNERVEIIQDFERARRHLLSVFILELSHWREAPAVVFGVGHHKAARALACYKLALDSGHDHSLLEYLRSPELADDWRYFESLAGELPVWQNPLDAPWLRRLLGKLRLAPSAERRAEGLHTIVHKDIMRCPHHSPSLISFATRYQQIISHVTQSDLRFVRFAESMSKIPNGHVACNQLGLKNHPMTVACKNPRNPMHYKVIDRADAYSKYTMASPEVSSRVRHCKPTPGMYASITCNPC